jgi:hypothetical protein
MQGEAERATFSTAVLPEGAGVLLGGYSDCSGGLLQRRPSLDRSRLRRLVRSLPSTRVLANLPRRGDILGTVLEVR